MTDWSREARDPQAKLKALEMLWALGRESVPEQTNYVAQTNEKRFALACKECKQKYDLKIDLVEFAVKRSGVQGRVITKIYNCPNCQTKKELTW